MPKKEPTQEQIRKVMAALGRKGKGKAKARDPEKMRAAARKRWDKSGERRTSNRKRNTAS